MALGKGLKGFRVFAVGLLVAAPSVAYAHAIFTNPPARVNTAQQQANKIPPCGALPDGGAVAKKMPTVQYEAGATVPLEWTESVDHRGCFQVKLSTTGNDTDFRILGQWDDPQNGVNNTKFTQNVKLPDGVTCQNCTLQLTQLMIGQACMPDATAPTAQTYFSCIDVRIGDFQDAGPLAEAGPVPDEEIDEEPSPTGPTTSPTDGGGKTSSSSSGSGVGSRNLRAGEGDDGCSIGFGATTGVSFFVSAGIAAMALLRRRKKS